MRLLPIAALALSVLAVTGCTRWSMNHHLNNAYSAYDRGNCEQVMLELSKVERASRARPYVWPEVSMMRGQCLERQKMFVDAAQTYQFIIASYPQQRIRLPRPRPSGNPAEPGPLPDAQRRSGGAPDALLMTVVIQKLAGVYRLSYSRMNPGSAR